LSKGARHFAAIKHVVASLRCRAPVPKSVGRRNQNRVCIEFSYSDKDARILLAPPQCAENAAQEFLSRGKRLTLDLACGIGRDTFYLEGRALAVIGVDASFNGLRVAQRANLLRARLGSDRTFCCMRDGRLPMHVAGFVGRYGRDRGEGEGR
jgi:SAM-dependent methyltransferase